ncbi:hypothetical protein NCS57_00325200 [Fusarium keratoplasticum]|uniref:Uncharacterized protein n=1 Tax=Fusarium keratoplasticum TaxID=1328300 RepID=A0ACC0RD48_9HYPO|nr:hypothetical protein NCS57_00325200 [Fusarium keratoplasticum]KAI8680446.1 hypothetical protein NCS57_00325200 [Fusarium keratoplasticum]
MTREYKRWIFTKSTEYRPNGVLRVGQILAQPFEPASALHPAGPPELSDDVTLEESELDEVAASQANELSLHFGLYADLSGIAPAGSSANTTASKAQSQEWQIDKISSKIITPSISYVETCLRHGDVPAKLKDVWFFKKRLYMITGTRVVQGARMATTNQQTFTAGVEAQGDGTSSGVPVQIGTSGGIQKHASQGLSFGRATDFVFAYRLQEIFYYGVSKMEHHPFNKGETSSLDSAGPGQELEDDFDDFEMLRIDDEDFDGEGFDGIQEVDIPGTQSESILRQRFEGME